MLGSKRDLWWVLLAAAIVFLTNLGGPGLWDDDEPKNATCAREMLERGDWIVPTFNAELRTDKPILLYWLMLSSYKLLGVSEFSARLPSALLGMGTVCLTWGIGRHLFGRRVGLLAGLVLCGSLMFGVSSRAATPDATLIFCVTLSLFLFARSIPAVATDTPTLPATWTLSPRLALAVACALGLAVLAKGPSGVILPGGVMFVFVLALQARQQRLSSSSSSDAAPLLTDATFADVATAAQPATGRVPSILKRLGHILAEIASACRPRAVLAAALALHPLLLLTIVLAIALPWYILVGLATEGAWLVGFLGKHNVGRFLQAMEGHSGPIIYYIPAIVLGMLPWSVFLPQALAGMLRELRQSRRTCHGELFIVCWAFTYVIFFSFARTKLPSYVLPAYPAFALMLGRLLDEWWHAPATAMPKLPGVRAGLLGCACLGLAVAIGLPIASLYVLPGAMLLGAVGAVPVLGAAVGWYFFQRQRARPFIGSFAITAVGLATILFSVVSVVVDRYQNSERLAHLVRTESADQFSLATWDCFRPSLVFYAGQPVTQLHSPQQVADYLNAGSERFLITRKQRWEELQAQPAATGLPDDLQVLDQSRMFLRRQHELLLIGRKSSSPSPSPIRLTRHTLAP